MSHFRRTAKAGTGVLFLRTPFSRQTSLFLFSASPHKCRVGVQHVQWRARPRDYLVVRDAIIAAIRRSSASWDATLEQDWRRAITAIAVPMLQGAAVHTALIAEQMDDETNELMN